MQLKLSRLLKAPRARVLSRQGEQTRLAVDGIVCDEVCAVRTKEALERLPGVTSVTVDYEQGLATVEGQDHDEAAYSDAIAKVVAGMSGRRFIERITRRR